MTSWEEPELSTDAFYDALLDDNVEDLYENAPCGYLSTTPDGVIVKVNQTFLTWTGYSPDDLVGARRFSDLLSAGGRIYYETHLAPMLQMQGRVREIAVELICEGDRRLPALVNAVVKADAEGRPLVLRVVVFDATERRAYERELLRARQQAEAAEARARDLAHTLQSTFIPPEPPSLPGLDVGARYRPAGDGFEVGGDFYDVFETADREWAVVLGDVCGKGAGAATVTALARHTTRAAAVQDRSPSYVLRSLNGAILRQHVDRFCTALYVRIGLGGGDPRLTICSGGHLPPLHVTGAREATAVGSPGTLLGAFDDVELHETPLTLAPGEALVLYTDGVTEARAEDGTFYGLDRLRQAVTTSASAALTADEIADRLLAEVIGFQHGAPRDDIAVLVLKHPASGPG